MSRRSWSRCWLMATALISISAFCDGHGSPRWENVNDQFGKIQSYEKLTPFLVNIDEVVKPTIRNAPRSFFTCWFCKGYH